MQREKQEAKTVYRLPPCPAWDVEGMEGWLSDMAKDGLLLREDGFFMGVASFTCGEPQDVKYRLEASQKGTGIWAENGGAPAPEAVELGEKYGWFYVANRGDFYIYRSFDASAREMNTDPAVHALTLKTVKERRAGAAFQIAFWAWIYPMLIFRGGFFLRLIHFGTGLALFGFFLSLWLVADPLEAFISLGKLQKKLQSGESLSPKGDVRKHALRYSGRRFAKLLCVLLFVALVFHESGDFVAYGNKIPLEEYQSKPPFATMMDFAGDEAVYYRRTMTGKGFNSIERWSDWLAPSCVDWAEHAEITLKDGNILGGGLYVQYYETIHPFVARRLIEEWYLPETQEEFFKALELPALDVDFAAAYYNKYHYPCLVLYRGETAVIAEFAYYDEIVPLAELAETLVESLPC